MRNQFPIARPNAAQRGFTLIELLVSLLIGLFLLGGLLTLVQDNRRTFAGQNALSQLQDSERLAMTMMTDVIQSAGYFPGPTVNTPVSSLPAAGTMAAGQSIVGTFNAAAPGDTITVRYATSTGDTVTNCIGGTNTSGSTAPFLNTNKFSVVNGQLMCTWNGTPYPIVGAALGTPGGISVNSLSVLYGINSAGTGSNVDSYVTVAGVTNWSYVISVQLTLQFINPLYSATNVGQGNQPQFLTFQRIVSVMNQTGI